MVMGEGCERNERETWKWVRIVAEVSGKVDGWQWWMEGIVLSTPFRQKERRKEKKTS